MRFKIDENLPIGLAELLIAKGHDALMVFAQQSQGKGDSTIAGACAREGRIPVTLHLDLADMRTDPPKIPLDSWCSESVLRTSFTSSKSSNRPSPCLNGNGWSGACGS